MVFAMSCLAVAQVRAEGLDLQQIIDEALRNSPDLHASISRVSASEHRIPQAQTLPDPMFSFGYQNEGFRKFTYGNPDNPNAQGIFSVSQTFPFPGKLALKGEAAARDSESVDAAYTDTRLKIISRVKELYFDLYDTYKTIDLINERLVLFRQVEDAALARYSTGKGSQQEVLMAQTEKYMLLEKVEMLRQKIESFDAMLNSVMGRPAGAPLKRPSGMPLSDFIYTLDELIKISAGGSPVLQAKDRIVSAAETRVAIARKDCYPDFTITGSYFPRGNNLDNMWSLTTSVNIPIFYRSKQKQAVNEAEASLSEARSEKEAARLMIASAIGDNYAMLKASDRLMSLYKDGLIPKSSQDVELALSGYKTGTVDALTVITRIKAVIDYEISYWSQAAEHEKAIARIEALTGLTGTAVNKQDGN